MSVSVVIPSRGTARSLSASVRDMLRAAAVTGPDAEVLVVVNGRADAPGLRGTSAPGLRVIHLDEANVSRARNVGIAEARHPTVIFGDDGASCDESLCADLAAGLADPRYPVVTGPVRVPVVGPVTAYLNHQRVFDAPPIDGEFARTVTGLCALRRDRLPAEVRYDERRLGEVGEDVAFGHAVRAAGFPIRWLGGIAPGRHLLPDRVTEITGRMTRYGRGGALVWLRDGAGVMSPPEVLRLYTYLASPGYRAYRRFSEVDDPGTRAAYVVYDYLYDLSFMTGYLGAAGVIEVDEDGLSTALADLAANLRTGGYDADFERLDAAEPAEEPLLDRVRAVLARFAPPPAAPAARPDRSVVAARADSPELARLHDTWRLLRAAGQPITADRLDAAARAVGHPFRDACAAIERAGLRRSAP